MVKNNIRSLLFVPAQQYKLQKIRELRCDALILDLEDSIKKEDKESALKNIEAFLSTYAPKETAVFIRVNKDNMSREIESLQFPCVDGFVLPKFEDIKTLEKLKEAVGSKKIIALIETPMGIINLHSIAGCSDVWAIAFGAEDYCSETGTKNEEQYLLPIKTDIVKYTRAYGKKCFDTITLEIKRKEQIQQAATHSQNIGFDGKLAIHPSQVDIIDTVFCHQNKEYMLKILEAFERCETGVMKFDGKIYERPHIESIKRKLKK